MSQATLYMEDVEVGTTMLGLDFHILDAFQTIQRKSLCGKQISGLRKATVMLDLDAEGYRTVNGKRTRIAELKVEGRHVCNRCVDSFKLRRKRAR